MIGANRFQIDPPRRRFTWVSCRHAANEDLDEGKF